jgi:excisionase family DNA binding protein
MALEISLMTVAEAANLIGCTVGYVRRLLIEGKLRGQKFGVRVWMVDRDSALEYRDYVPTTGRPRRVQKN